MTLVNPPDVTVTTVAGKSATGPADVFTYTAPRVVCVVPKLKRRRLRAAKPALRKRHCRLGKVSRKRRARAPRTAKIIKQRPRPGAVRPAGTKVNVTLLVRKKAPQALGSLGPAKPEGEAIVARQRAGWPSSTQQTCLGAD